MITVLGVIMVSLIALMAVGVLIESLHLIYRIVRYGVDESGDFYMKNGSKILGSTLKVWAFGDKVQKFVMAGSALGIVLGAVLVIVWSVLFVVSLGTFQKKWVLLMWIAMALVVMAASGFTLKYISNKFNKKGESK